MNTLKKIFSLLLVISMILSVLSLTACNKDKGNDGDKGKENVTNNGNTDKTYTVTVLDTDGAPVEGVSIMISTTYEIKTTDNSGKISFESETGDVSIMVTSIPNGYEDLKLKQINFTSEIRNLTIKLEKTPEVKTTVCQITVKDQYGNAVANVGMQLCNEICTPCFTDENGVANITLKEGVEYKVEILNVPEGYSAPTGYLEEKIIGGTATAEIVITLN